MTPGNLTTGAFTALLAIGATAAQPAPDAPEVALTTSSRSSLGITIYNGGEALVREGMAWARLGMSHGYVVQEAQSASRFLGVHNHHCEQPEIWRARNEQFQRNESGGSE